MVGRAAEEVILIKCAIIIQKQELQCDPYSKRIINSNNVLFFSMCIIKDSEGLSEKRINTQTDR